MFYELLQKILLDNLLPLFAEFCSIMEILKIYVRNM